MNPQVSPVSSKPVKRRTIAVIGTQWAVLSVLLIWLIGFVASGWKDRPMLTAVRISLLIGGHLLALCLPGIILIRTQLRNETARMIAILAVAPAVLLTGLRFLEMNVERIDCYKDCANSIPYASELQISYALPFILVLIMYLIAWIALPRR
jgi:hypothetical protein